MEMVKSEEAIVVQIEPRKNGMASYGLDKRGVVV